MPLQIVNSAKAITTWMVSNLESKFKLYTLE